MILSEISIQQVRDVPITDVVSQYVKLNRTGQGLCPFHNEKTPSFKVTASKDLFKCFGCGESGDAISFVMKHDKLDFITAVETIAARHSIALHYDEVPDKEKYQEQKALKDQLKEVIRITNDQYKKNLFTLPDGHPVWQYLAGRGWTRETMLEWELGWATEDWRHISPGLIQQNFFTPAEKLGIIKRSKETNYDGYRSRITIPITNRTGEPIGLAGRFIMIDEADKDKEYPKYINPPENDIYSKSTVLFGLSRAIKPIERKGFAYLVEGYFDVTSMHLIGDDNTVGKCGTAFTPQQAALLKKYTNHVIILGDGDKAGRAATVKDLKVLLKAGFKTEIAILPDSEDPDSYIQGIRKGQYPGDVLNEDGVTWYVSNLMKDIGSDEFKLGTAKEDILRLLSLIPNDIIRSNYFDSVVRKYKWQKSELQKQLTSIIDATIERQEEEDDGLSNLDRMPGWMDKEEFLRNGFCSVNTTKRTGYYSFSSSGQVEITNFLITPLMHIYAGKESRHLIQIDNGRKKAVLDIESNALVSIDLLQKYVVCEGPYIIYGSKPQMLRIATTLLGNFPRCVEVKFLGWQQAGFFSFVDKVYIPGKGLQDLDQWGILKFSDQNYLVPAASAAYKELQATGEDPYEMDRQLTYLKSSITFSEWATLMAKVYREKGPVGIAFVILSLFRDIVFDIDNNCPHLYGFGEKSSGKSKWAESISAAFYKKRSAFNLNSGTDYAFFAYMQRFRNTPTCLNEFDEKVIRPEWFQAIKGVYDGEGRHRGVMGTKNRTEIMKISSTIVLMGQFLCTMDDNSIVSRSIIEGFNVQEYTQEDKNNYDLLKMHEEAGLSSILLELLELRPQMKEYYRDTFNETLGSWRRTFDGDMQNFNQRIMQNWCHLYTGWKIISERISLPISNKEFEEYCRKNALKWCSFIRSSDTLSEFWNTIAFLADQGTLIEGWDYKIEQAISVKLRNGRDEEVTLDFQEPTKIIYMRMNNIHKHYQQAYRNRTGKEGMTMENLQHYFSSRKYYLGKSKQSKFKKYNNTVEPVPKVVGFNRSVMEGQTKKQLVEQNTSSFVFLYEPLAIDLEKEVVEQEEFVQTDQTSIWDKMNQRKNLERQNQPEGPSDVPFS